MSSQAHFDLVESHRVESNRIEFLQCTRWQEGVSGDRIQQCSAFHSGYLDLELVCCLLPACRCSYLSDDEYRCVTLPLCFAILIIEHLRSVVGRSERWSSTHQTHVIAGPRYLCQGREPGPAAGACEQSPAEDAQCGPRAQVSIRISGIPNSRLHYCSTCHLYCRSLSRSKSRRQF